MSWQKTHLSKIEMKINMVLSIMAMIFSLFLFSVSFAEFHESDLPQSADISVSGIKLLDRISTESILGINIEKSSITSKDHEKKAIYLNKGMDQVLLLIFHPGSNQNSYSEFRVEKILGNAPVKYSVLDNINNFETGKGIRLGMNENELIEILGSPIRTDREKGKVILKYSIDNFESSKFLQHYNLPEYFGIYTFTENKLIKLWFGFSYP